jgi:hypothetical protein
MAIFQVDIPDELVPGIVAASFADEKEPEEVVAAYALAVATKACQDFKVGPYFTGPIPPQFNADGTPYIAAEVEE